MIVHLANKAHWSIGMYTLRCGKKVRGLSSMIFPIQSSIWSWISGNLPLPPWGSAPYRPASPWSPRAWRFSCSQPRRLRDLGNVDILPSFYQTIKASEVGTWICFARPHEEFQSGGMEWKKMLISISIYIDLYCSILIYIYIYIDLHWSILIYLCF